MNNINKTELLVNAIKIGLVGVSTVFMIKWALKELDPTNKNKKELRAEAEKKLKSLNIDVDSLTDHELVIASHLVDPTEIEESWDAVAGLDHIVKDIQQTVIFPIKHKGLFANSRLTKPPKGILLYGPPGCGKTLTAKALAKEAGMNFINLDISILTDKWYGESQKLAAAVFSVAKKIQPCVIFIDEIDSFLRARSSSDHEATAMMKAQFMALWDGIATDNECISIVMGATNRPLDLDPAILRRMPKRYSIPLPSLEQRKAILELVLSNEKRSPHVDYRKLAEKSEGFSGSDLQELCRTAGFRRINLEFIKKCSMAEKANCRAEVDLPEITMEDVERTIDNMKQSDIMQRRIHSNQQQRTNSSANESDA